MNYQKRLFGILRIPHVSEKTNIQSEKYNTVVFKVAKYATKLDIKNAIRMLFEVKVNNVNTMIVSGKTKGSMNKIGVRSDWKKAYVLLDKGKKIDFVNRTE